MSKPLMLLLMIASVCTAACGQKNTTPPAEPSANIPTPVASPSPEPTPQAVDEELETKKKALAFALQEDSIKSDPKGQWAIKAEASSSFASDLNDPQAGYHPMQATGAPNVAAYSDDQKSWAAKEADSGIEWLQLEYAKPVTASEIRIRQTHSPGAIAKIEAFDETGAAQLVWTGPDNSQYAAGQIGWLNVNLQSKPIKTQKIKITLATNMVSGWNEIDAVQLVGE